MYPAEVPEPTLNPKSYTLNMPQGEVVPFGSHANSLPLAQFGSGQRGGLKGYIGFRVWVIGFRATGITWGLCRGYAAIRGLWNYNY